ncbi:hypothetical protein TYRP_014603 [Tyrophagus putrescentiae]|nr:hypothetical protein TYRP_014603 [Tyrophagus putrescentiae]
MKANNGMEQWHSAPHGKTPKSTSPQQLHSRSPELQGGHPPVLMVIINCHASGSGAGSEWKIGIAGAELQEESSAITATAAAAE